ncbi:MAG: gliding motility protein GldN [Sphingobacteriales bacterium]|nr:gliding motility protein GldN [Sphingobacteriales bacterium]
MKIPISVPICSAIFLLAVLLMRVLPASAQPNAILPTALPDTTRPRIAMPNSNDTNPFRVKGSGVQRESYDEAHNPGGISHAQGNAAAKLLPALDGAYQKIAQTEREILAYPYLREADVFWQKRIWRVIDTQQKMNQTFTYPPQPFIGILLDAAQKPNVRLYMNDDFKDLITYADVEQRMGGIDTITVIDPVTYEESTKVVKNDFDWTSVTRFRLKEDWVFDKQRSKMVVRILGIAPIREVYDDNDNYRGEQAMFWAYYPDLRPYLVKQEAFNPYNDSNRLTWDDIFEMRYFSSFIMKESNMQDRRIQDYATDRDALLESERIKLQLLEKDENLWQY